MKGILILVKFICSSFAICVLLVACDQRKTSHSIKPSRLKTTSSKKSTNTHPVSDKTHSSEQDPKKGKLERFKYPQMSFCGGSLDGIYLNNKLIRIESTYGYDMGYSEKNIDFEDGRIAKIEYRQHDADWEKYNERYGEEEGDIDPRKMTYFDTLYILKFQPKREFSIYAGKKEVQGVVSKELIQRLLDCTATMQKELSTVRSKN
jgi:hypothetical protein